MIQKIVVTSSTFFFLLKFYKNGKDIRNWEKYTINYVCKHILFQKSILYILGVG